MKKPTLVLLVSSILHAIGAAGETIRISGPIADYHFRSNDEVQVTGDVVLGAGRVEPGARFMILGEFGIDISGPMQAGSEGGGFVEFAPGGTNTTSWRGVTLRNAAPGTRLFNCSFRGAADSAIQILNTPDLIIDGCTFSENYGVRGGAVHIKLDAGQVTIRNSKFHRNVADKNGGALQAECTGLARLEVHRCEFVENESNPGYDSGAENSRGGAIDVVGSALFQSVVFRSNACRGYTIWTAAGRSTAGGAAYVEGETEFRGCVFDANGARMAIGPQSPDWSYPWGGAIYSGGGKLTVWNCLFNGNTLTSQSPRAVYRGGAIYIAHGAAILNHVTVINNSAASAIETNSDDDQARVDLLNSIIFWNTPAGSALAGKATARYSDVEGGFAGEGNTDRHPFLSGAALWKPLSGSPAIDSGVPDPSFNEACGEMSMGTPRADLGWTGGPWGCLVAGIEPVAPQILIDADLDIRLMAGQSLTLRGPAEGYGPLEYQWFRDGSAIAGAKTWELKVSDSIGILESATYQLEVKNAFGKSIRDFRVAISDVRLAQVPAIVLDGIPTGKAYALEYMDSSGSWVALSEVIWSEIQQVVVDAEAGRTAHRLYRLRRVGP